MEIKMPTFQGCSKNSREYVWSIGHSAYTKCWINGGHILVRLEAWEIKASGKNETRILVIEKAMQ